MKKTILLLITILFSFSATFAVGENLSQISTKGLFNVEMSIPGKNLKVGKNTAEILVRDKNGKEVKGARISTLPLIHQRSESALVKPKVVETSEGRYSIENIYIEIPGHWVLKITIRKGNKEDSVTFDFPDVKREN